MIKSGFTGRNSNRANTGFTIGLFTILIALSVQYIGGYQPCELCLTERLPYYIGLPVIAVVIGAWKVMPTPPRIILTLIAAGLFVWGTGLGVYHAGVEWHFWPGPTACTGTGAGTSFSDLSDINATKIVPCDAPAFRILGISMAGYNALVSAVIAFFLFWSALGQFQRCQLDLKKLHEEAEKAKAEG